MKNKFLLCFRPINAVTDDFIDDRNFSSTTLSNNEDARKSLSKSSILERDSPKGSGRRSTQTQSRNLIRSFSGTLRPAFFEISLKKKYPKTKPSQLTINSKISELNATKVFYNIINSQSTPTESSASSLTSTSSNPSPTAKELIEKRNSNRTVFITLSQKSHIADKVNDGSTLSVRFLLLLTVSLGITLFYGRVCAVIFTTLYLYFLSRRTNDEIAPPESSERTSHLMDISARDHRKRVIMEGILERSHQSH